MSGMTSGSACSARCHWRAGRVLTNPDAFGVRGNQTDSVASPGELAERCRRIPGRFARG
jgi:hypothetical protein